MAKPKPKARLEDLEVREVSLVDRPANKRPFLIIKRRDDDMPRRAIPASEAVPATVEKQTAEPTSQPKAEEVSFIDIIDPAAAVVAAPADPTAEPIATEPPAGDPPATDPPAATEGDPSTAGDPPATDPAEEPTDPGTGDPPVATPTETVQKADQALEQATDLLQRLTAAVNVLKNLGDAQINDTFKVQLEALAGELAAMAGTELGEVAKATDPPLRVVTNAMERMISQVAALQKAGDGAVPEAVPGELSEVAKAISSLIQPDVPEPAAEDVLFPFEVFKAADADPNDPDPIVLIKAGAKMKKARLSQFAKAVEALQSILAELKGDLSGEKVKKSGDAAMLATLTTMIDSVKTAVTTRLETIEQKIGKVGDRVDKIENTRPVGNEADPPAKPVKKNDDEKNFWSGVL